MPRRGGCSVPERIINKINKRAEECLKNGRHVLELIVKKKKMWQLEELS